MLPSQSKAFTMDYVLLRALETSYPPEFQDHGMFFTAVYRMANDKIPLREMQPMFMSIKPRFIRYLLSNDSRDDMWQWGRFAAVMVLMGFCHAPEVAAHPNMLMHLETLLDIVCKYDINSRRGPSITVMAFGCLSKIAECPEGRKALMEKNAVQNLSKTYASTTAIMIVDVLQIVTCLLAEEKFIWSMECAGLFHKVMNKMALELKNIPMKHKFELCKMIQLFLSTCSKDITQSMSGRHSWPENIRNGLGEIFSREINQNKRIQALTLASVSLTHLGIDWMFADMENPGEFFILLVQAMVIEIKVQLEAEKSTGMNIDTFKHCISIFEAALMEIERLELLQTDGQPLIRTVGEIFQPIVDFLRPISSLKNRNLKKIMKQKCVGIVVKPMIVWLTRNMVMLRSEAIDALPVLLKIANTSFYMHQSVNLTKNDKVEPAGNDSSSPDVDILQNILFLLRDLAQDRDICQVLLQEQQNQVFFNCFEYHWSILQAHSPLKNKNPDEFNRRSISTRTIQDICAIFTAITEQFPEFVDKSPTFLSIRELVLDNFPKRPPVRENVPLSTHFLLLGLRLLIATKTKIDQRVKGFVKALIFILNDVTAADNIAVAEMKLAMMKSLPDYLNKNMDWFADFAVDSECAAGVSGLLKKAEDSAIDSDIKSAYKNVLIRLINANLSVAYINLDKE